MIVITMLLWLLTLPTISVAIGYGEGAVGDSSMITFTHTSMADSVQAIFEYPDGTIIDTLILKPLDADSTLLEGNLSGMLTTPGTHKVRFNVWETGATSISEIEYGSFRMVSDAKIDSVLETVGYKSGAKDSNVGVSTYVDSILAMVENIPNPGGGTYPCSVYVHNGSEAIELAGVTLTGGGVSQFATGNNQGYAVFSLNSDTYLVTVSATNYTQNVVPETLTVSDAAVMDSVQMTFYAPGSPTSPEQVTCWTDVWDVYGDTVDNAILEAKVYKRGPYFDADGDPVLIPDDISAQANNNGRAELILIETAEATNRRGDSLKYIFKLISPGRSDVTSRVLTAPDSTTWKIDWGDQ